ncbi:MAG TPA: hypothetical protein VFB54_07435 [Burkholderiales bacterium]|nr:hypothetical protein [Burkholderiales bacterium]
MPSPFVSFRMSYTEISSQAGTTRVTSRSARFEGGKLMTQTFEGELDRSAFEPLVQQAQRQFATHMALLLQPFSWFLPLSRRRSSDTD